MASLHPSRPSRLSRSRSLFGVVVLAVAASARDPESARAAKGPDPAERGLDMFVHAASSAVAGDSLALDLIAYGFPSVTVAKPLPAATIEAAWDPESLGPGIDKAPADVSGATDAQGHAHLDIPVPPGEARKLALLVALRHGEHVRTKKIDVQRTGRTLVELRIPDSAVVPGSQMPAWVTVTDARDGGPVRGAPVDVTLLEGDVELATERVTTDASGLSRSTFYVPLSASGVPALSLRARLVSSMFSSSPVQSLVGLRLREESPATPHLLVRWKEIQLKPGETGHAEVKVLDAADEPLANHAVVYWTGPKGTTAPQADDEWKKSGTVAKTDGLGVLVVQAQAPRVVTNLGSDVTIVARTEIEGQKLEQRQSLTVGQPVASATVDLESGELVPGITQRAYLTVTDGEKGVAGDFLVEADGLKAKVTTNPSGEAELTWNVPEDVGAKRDVGPCAGGVAASVVVRQAKPIAALSRHAEPFELCVNVARERASVLRTSVQVAKIGDRIRASVIGNPKRAAKGAGSVVVVAPERFGTTFWATPANNSGSIDAEVDLSKATQGVHEISVAIPQPSKAAETSSTRILVVPKILPKLASKLAGGHIAPGGEAEVDIVLSDGHGAPVVGAVSAIVIDKEGGGSVSGLERIDTRNFLCDSAGADREHCDAFLEGDPSADLLRRSTLTTRRETPLGPLADPAAHTTEALKKTFSDVLHSLEGAVFQSQTPESLRDVRRKENGRWVFNPELMTLVTAAMNEPPTTPGGEPFGLSDLIAVDPQVSFDNVARRVTRLKLFNVLAAVRTFKQNEKLDAEEPALNDPNALLRRLVRDNTLAAEGLLDPWGGTIQFVKTGAPPVPFLTAVRGYALQAPGPDGKIGTADDVKDPFERVVKSSSPYADAMGEDEIVDAKWNMRVGDATVSGWQDMFARLTGTALGSGSGTGTGQGFGSGHGRLGGSHETKAPSLRMGAGIVTESARWTDPQRTDAQGRARIRVPLGDYETTWRIAFLARSDAGQTAVSVLDVPTFLPVSARVDLGRKLTLGDEVGGRIVVRNRTNAAKAVSLELTAEGGLQLAPKEPRVITVHVPPSSLRSVFTRVVTKSEGKGTLTVALRAPGTDGDRTTQEVGIDPPGEPRVLASSAWLGGKGTLAVDVPPGYQMRGTARLVIESGVEDALLAALNAIEPENGSSPESLADAIEVSARIEKLAEKQGKHWLVTRTRKLAAIARAHMEALQDPSGRARMAAERARLYPPPHQPKAALPRRASASTTKKPEEEHIACPKTEEIDAIPVASLLEAEPPPDANGPLACFTSLTARADSKAALDRARAAHAYLDRPHRMPLATTVVKELAQATRADNLKSLPVFEGTRAERAIVFSALSRSAHLWSKAPQHASHRYLEALFALRDARGGYGSTEATRDVVRALVDFDSAASKPGSAKVTVRDGGSKQIADVPSNGNKILSLGQQTKHVEVDVAGGPVIVRFERPVLRTWSAPPDSTITPVSVSVDWPNDARAGTTNVVHVTYKSALGHTAALWTRMPLPPGVELAAPVKDVRLRQGVVHIRTSASSSETVALPIRFTLPGKTIVPEAETRTTSEEQPRALTPSRSLVVK